MTMFMVAQMHDKFKFKALDKPGFLKPDIMKMRLNFLLEELVETAEACGYELEVGLSNKTARNVFFSFVEAPSERRQVDLEKALDGLVDLEVVLHGTAHLMGFHNHVPDMVTSKYATIWSEAKWRVHKANMAKERVAVGQVGKRGSSHDLIKPKGWKPPEFGDLLK